MSESYFVKLYDNYVYGGTCAVTINKALRVGQ